MSANEAVVAPEPGGEASLNTAADLLFDATVDTEVSSPLSELLDDVQNVTQNGVAEAEDDQRVVKLEKDSDVVDLTGHTTATTLRPDPPPSKKRRESEVDSATPDFTDRPNNKKRKRGPSPPWQFPTAETTTLKTADGRRASARVNTGTPSASEQNGQDDARARSSSLSAPSQLRSRLESPPWKKFAAEGPTSLVVDGKRKSGRVNKELSDPPKRVSPRSKKVDGKVSNNHANTTKPISSSKALQTAVNGTSHHKPTSPTLKKSVLKQPSRPSSSPDNASKIAEIKAQIQALKPSRSFQSQSPERSKHSKSHKRKQSAESRSFAQHDGPHSPKMSNKLPPDSKMSLSPDTHRPSPRIKLRFTPSRTVVPPPHPHAVFPSPTRPPGLSIFHVMEQYELKEAQQPYTENERGPPNAEWFAQRAERQAVEEGAMRQRILREAEPGGRLSKEKLSIFQDVDRQKEPPKEYAHFDHLVGHALFLRHLQQREKSQHKLLAKKIATEALDKWKSLRGPTEEDIRLEQERTWKLIYKQVVVDVKAKWDMVNNYVQFQRRQAWDAEQEVQRQARLREKLEWSENLVARLRGEEGTGSELETGEGSDAEDEDSESESGEENMTDSSSAEAEDEEDADGAAAAKEMDEEELKAYLAQRESEAPDTDLNEHQGAELDSERNADDVSMAERLDSEAQSEAHLETEDVSMADLLGQDDKQAEDAPDEEFEPNNIQDAQDAEGEDHLTDTEHSIRRSHRSSAAPGLDTENEADDNLSDDDSVDMDSSDYDSDEDMSSTGDEDNVSTNEDGEDEDEDVEGSGAEQVLRKNPLLSLFKDEIKAAAKTETKAGGLPTPTTSAEGDEVEGEGQAEAGAVVAEPGDEVAEAAELKPEEEPAVGAESSVMQRDVSEPVATPHSPAESVHEKMAAPTENLVSSPALLRGTLRSYQHTGVDWLAKLWNNNTSGILADEMGLGKTIQTIALFAHLAEEHEVWESHLVIVPTSVVLNWVTEFQRFLPGFRVLGYYGSAEERQLKRKGWVNDPHHEIKEKRGYNVVITSYNVAMQDINAIRNVQWHYLVLDEAHNIRNFNSQRWQVLIRLKTKARLLLTGTPLQNSLTELWSLLTFLTAGDDDPKHGSLEEFLSNWKQPVQEIFDRGVQTLSDDAQRVVSQLHISLRPFLLRRLKSEVEKDLPKKTESVVVCKLSKRQRQLYQEYMGLAETKRSLAQGNAVSAGKVLLSLRRVCNHPDLFDPRGVGTSVALERWVGEDFDIKEIVVRRLLGLADADPPVRITAFEDRRKYALKRSRQLDAVVRLEKEAGELDAQISGQPEPDAMTLVGAQALQRLRLRQKKLEHLRSCIRTSKDSLNVVPIYGSDLRELLTIQHGRAYKVAPKDIRGRVVARHLRGWPVLGRYPLKFEMDHLSDWLLSQTTLLQTNVQTAGKYAERLHETLVRFAFCTPEVTAPVLNYAIPERIQQLLRASDLYPTDHDYAHEARVRTTIVFPDSRLLVYDSGKLQRLTVLLRELQSRGSRSLIFTQMTGTLNILEKFLSLMNLPYLRLDGSTPVERRALYAAEFNREDSKYQCMILSSRAGGVGLNLTGASSVIFFDLDWNPQMDRQCMDRAHRIGQVRDVSVYKMVSEKTVEENILRRAEMKSLLDQTVIQEGHFTTEAMRSQRKKGDEEGEDDVEAAIERFLGGGDEKKTNQALESVEDREDVAAAQQARKEEHQDDADFAEKSSKDPSRLPTPGHQAGDGIEKVEEGEGGDEERGGHLDAYLVRLMQFLYEGVPFVPPVTRKMGKDGRDPGHRKRKR